MSTILGLTVARHFLELRAFAGASDDDIARVVQQWISADSGAGGGRPPPG